ncbi:MAG: polyprenyl diphosphate synthase [Vulcanimicrobiaceae bacterium]
MIENARAALAGGAPRHVAIIMDGNRRWARERGLSSLEGHRAGVRALRETARACARRGIEVLTVFAFSEENWRRPASEVGPLMELVRWFALRECAPLARERVRVRAIGRLEALPPATRAAVAALEERTAGGERMLLNLALNYGARSELCDAMRALAREVEAGRLAPEAIGAETLERYLCTAGLPDPDLLIRTGGELRVSNFLLYQIAYAELWSTPVHWPAFDAPLLDEALGAFAGRVRRFGS